MPALFESMNALDFSLSLNLPANSHRRNDVISSNLMNSRQLSFSFALQLLCDLIDYHALSLSFAFYTHSLSSMPLPWTHVNSCYRLMPTPYLDKDDRTLTHHRAPCTRCH